FGYQVWVGELVAAHPLHPQLDVPLNARRVRFARLEAQEGVMVGRPGLARQLQPGADEVMTHARRMPDSEANCKPPGLPWGCRFQGDVLKPAAASRCAAPLFLTPPGAV